MSLISIEISSCKRYYNSVKERFLHNSCASTKFMQIQSPGNIHTDVRRVRLGVNHTALMARCLRGGVGCFSFSQVKIHRAATRQLCSHKAEGRKLKTHTHTHTGSSAVGRWTTIDSLSAMWDVFSQLLHRQTQFGQRLMCTQFTCVYICRVKCANFATVIEC